MTAFKKTGNPQIIHHGGNVDLQILPPTVTVKWNRYVIVTRRKAAVTQDGADWAAGDNALPRLIQFLGLVYGRHLLNETRWENALWAAGALPAGRGARPPVAPSIGRRLVPIVPGPSSLNTSQRHYQFSAHFSFSL